nr:ATP-dependent DNA helicase DinG [Motiliproteus sp. SC1-56]
MPKALREEVQGAYRQYLESKGYRPRYGQRLMIAEAVKGLLGAEGRPAFAVVEAGTGTGKTVAYMLAALPVARHLDKRLVISTATVALQEQIVFKDLPDLQAHSGLEFTFELAKGRGRYLCLSKLDQLLQQHEEQDPNRALYEDEQALRLDEGSYALYRELSEAYVRGDWDGDRDNWPDELDYRQWQPVTTDHRQCTNRRCAHFSGCSFFRARQGLEQADCIVANHDLVLSDLSLGGGAILSDPQDTLYVFDEGHHLADKALQHFSHRVRVRATGAWLKQLPKTLHRLLKELGNPDALARHLAPTGELIETAVPLLTSLDQLGLELEQQTGSSREREQHFRFSGGQLPSALIELSGQLSGIFGRLATQLDASVETLKEAITEPLIGIPREEAERWFPILATMQGRLENALGLWRDYAAAATEGPLPQARWLSRLESITDGEDREFCASPILAAEALREQLWDKCAGAVVTSATLTALDRFDHLLLQTGLPADARFSRVPSPFQYEQAAEIRIPRLSADPSDPQGHDAAVVETLESALKPDQSALVLFTSWRQMLAVRDAASKELRARILAQGEHSKQELLRRHRERVDEGKGSVLFGLASFAEGVDLPGAYLQHVVIAKIPFGVPGHPVDAALYDWVRERGGDPFMELSVPEASVRLIQACGRLIRSEQDRGVITLLDNRLRSKRYGRALLDALPPFRRCFD